MREPRFPHNQILSLLDVHRSHNLAESTSFDLTYDQLLDQHTLARLRSTPASYGSSLGLPELRQHLANALQVQPNNVILTTGASLALFLLAIELTGPAHHALVVTPAFPPSIDALHAADAHVTTHRLQFDNAYQLDPKPPAKQLTPRPRLVSLASPQNPSGISIPRQHIASIAQRLQQIAPEAFLLVDETYREAAIDDQIQPSCAPLAPNVITTASFSKAHGAPGLRIGWLTTHSQPLLQRLRTAKLNTANTTPIADEILALSLVEKSTAILAERRALLQENLARLARFAEEHAHLIEWIRPDAGALSCARLRESVYDQHAVEHFHHCLAEHDLQVADGRWFHEQPRVIRIGFGMQRGVAFDEALGALAAALHDAAPTHP